MRVNSPATLAHSVVGLCPPISQLGSDPDPLPDRLMVGLRFLVPSIGVRVPVRQLRQKYPAFAGYFCSAKLPRQVRERRRKPVRGTGISSQGRERIVSKSEAIMKQTTPDRVPVRQQSRAISKSLNVTLI